MAIDFDSYVLKFLRASEAAALGSFFTIGFGDAKNSDHAAVSNARAVLNSMDINGVIIVGEGERDKAPMLHVGEAVGMGNGPDVDIAIDPLECTASCALGKSGSMASLAFGPRGCMMGMPDVYMEKIAVGVHVQDGAITLDNSVEVNVLNLARILDRPVEELRIVVLNRSRHDGIITAVRKIGARAILIDDGDIYGVLSTAMGENDMYIGTGGSPEGVLAAAGLRCLGGFIEARLVANTDDERRRIEKRGISDISKLYHVEDLARGEVCFISTGVTDGNMVAGVASHGNGIYSLSSLMMMSSGEVTNVERVVRV